MQSLTCVRELDAPPEAVREVIDDTAAFVRAAGFDEVTVDGDAIRLRNQVGLLTMELELAVVEREGVALAYEQRDGFFESMQSEYAVEPAGGGSRVTGRTAFALDLAVVGPVLDATVIERQRRRELEAQFDYLERVA